MRREGSPRSSSSVGVLATPPFALLQLRDRRMPATGHLDRDHAGEVLLFVALGAPRDRGMLGANGDDGLDDVPVKRLSSSSRRARRASRSLHRVGAPSSTAGEGAARARRAGASSHAVRGRRRERAGVAADGVLDEVVVFFWVVEGAAVMEVESAVRGGAHLVSIGSRGWSGS